MQKFTSWGRYPHIKQQGISINWRHEALPVQEATVLPYGNGRSYGDCCLNEKGLLLATAQLDHFIRFDSETGVLRCESGVTLDEILRLIIPHGWFLPVTPGTRYVTIGGAIANDVHGKNHHKAGTFGCHVIQLELIRSNGERLICSREKNAEYFNATIAGLGLTGLVSWAEIQLKPIHSSNIEGESIRFSSIDEFLNLSRDSDQDWEYTVSWIDGVASGNQVGRGIFYRGNHVTEGELNTSQLGDPRITFPVDAPAMLLNKLSITMMNQLIYHKHNRKKVRFVKDLVPFFYPLDKIGAWNRMYGKQGFLQFQCVLPLDTAKQGLEIMMNKITRLASGSFLAVLKVFGEQVSPGLLSFPRHGVTLAMDFPFRGSKTLELFQWLDDVVSEHGGAIYPAKDACMSGAHFMKYYPAYEQFSKLVDPKFSSSLWRRVYES